MAAPSRARISEQDRARVLTGFTGVPAVPGNTVEILHDEEILPAMLAAIRSARRTVDLMTYVWWNGAIADEFADTLAERAASGVRVRVLLDGIGCRHLDSTRQAQMREAGVQLEVVRPRWSWKVWQLNMRTHRRVLVCDDEVAFTGGVGIAAEWMGVDGLPPWRETHLRLRGPAVDGVHSGFYSDWIETPHPPVDGHDHFPEHPQDGSVTAQVLLAASQPGWNTMALALWLLIDTAHTHLRITSGYFRPPGHFRRLLCHAADRGVAVDVLVPGPHAHPSISRTAAHHHYGELLRHGIRIHEYQPTMLHAKVVTVDGRVSLVGTANFDARSLTLNEQIAVLLHDEGLTRQLDRRFEEDLSRSRRIRLEEWEDRSMPERAGQWLAHVSTFAIRGAGATKRGGIAGDR